MYIESFKLFYNFQVFGCMCVCSFSCLLCLLTLPQGGFFPSVVCNIVFGGNPAGPDYRDFLQSKLSLCFCLTRMHPYSFSNFWASTHVVSGMYCFLTFAWLLLIFQVFRSDFPGTLFLISCSQYSPPVALYFFHHGTYYSVVQSCIYFSFSSVCLD